MNASELRIGNWLKGAEGTAMPHDFQVEAWHIGAMYEFEKTARRFVDWTPIPLTEEWLIKLGIDPAYGKGVIKCDLRYSGKTSIMPDYDGPYLNIVVKYVHQLQNLYFALIGEELEIKTKPVEK